MCDSARSARWTRGAIAAAIALATPRLAEAVCQTGIDFGQLAPSCGSGYCYVVSPGQHNSQTLAGSFWAFGGGSPVVNQGSDNGAWPVGGWLQPSGTNLYIGGTWQSNPAIDGCITGRIVPGKPTEIMMVALSDEGGGRGYFAVASTRRFLGFVPEFDFTFVDGGGQASDISLVEIPRARIVSVTRPDTYRFGGPTLSQISPGLYGDGSLTPEEMATGYRIYSRSQPPTSLKTSDGWTAISGIVPLGQDISFDVPCPPATGELFFAYALVFDGGFQTAHVGQPQRGTCNLCAASDRDGDGFSDNPECCPDQQVCDCNDLDANAHPGALEVCNGIDDNCNSVIDDVALPGAVASIALEKQAGTTRLEWPPLAAATGYDAVRGDLSTLLTTSGSFQDATQICVANDVTVSHVDDPQDPDPGGHGFWYLVRGGNCAGVGSYDTLDPSQSASRDAGIAASGHACP